MKKIIAVIICLALFMPLCCESENINLDFFNIRISEVMASNTKKIIMTSAGKGDDWIELCNVSDQDINLEGLCLSDSINKLEKFVFPAVIIPAHGYIIVFCSGEESTADDELHTAFKLSADKEKVVISYQGIILDRVDFKNQLKGISYAKDDNGTWHQTVTPTPGYENIITGLD